jgi:hypothetical protein
MAWLYAHDLPIDEFRMAMAHALLSVNNTAIDDASIARTC